MDSQTSLNFTASEREHQQLNQKTRVWQELQTHSDARGSEIGPFKINFEFKLLNVFSRCHEGTLPGRLGLASCWVLLASWNSQGPSASPRLGEGRRVEGDWEETPEVGEAS